MVQVIKFTFLDDCGVIESKVADFMKYQSKDLESNLSIPSLINKSLENVCELTINDYSSLIVINKGDHFYFLELLKGASVKFIIEDKTNLYYENKLMSFVSDIDLQKFNEVLAFSLSVDDVLDKISESGIEHLSDVDRLILERN